MRARQAFKIEDRIAPHLMVPDPCANIGCGRLQELRSGAPEESRKVIWGNNLVDGTRAALGPNYDVGRGGVAAAGGACCIGIRGALEVEGRKVGSIAKFRNKRSERAHENAFVKSWFSPLSILNSVRIPCGG